MNILVENQDTQEYLTEAGGWTKNPLEGKRYPVSRAAFRAAKQSAIGKFKRQQGIRSKGRWKTFHRVRYPLSHRRPSARVTAHYAP